MVTNVMEKRQSDKVRAVCQVEEGQGIAIVNSVVSRGLTEKVTFEQRPGGGRGMSALLSKGTSPQASPQGTASAKYA